MASGLQQAVRMPIVTSQLERLFAKSVPVFINVRDRLEPLTRLLDWLNRAGHDNITLINVASSYPPLLKFLEACPYRVITLSRNLGPTALWMLPEVKAVIRNQWFVYTDSDVVPREDCPLDAVAYLYQLLQRFPNYLKAGLGLCLDDIPDRYRQKQSVIAWESGLYGREVAPGVFQADVDTTFALYRPSAPCGCPALRTRGLYEARHAPWYIDSAAPDEEEVYYHAHAWPVARHWRLSGDNGGRPRVPPIPGGWASQMEADPHLLLTRIVHSRSGQLARAYGRARRLAGRPARRWAAGHCATAAEAQQAILEMICSEEWQATVNMRSVLLLLESKIGYWMERSRTWRRRSLLASPRCGNR